MLEFIFYCSFYDGLTLIPAKGLTNVNGKNGKTTTAKKGDIIKPKGLKCFLRYEEMFAICTHVGMFIIYFKPIVVLFFYDLQ